MRYLMTFSYDGSRFHGYQKQKGLRTVQEILEEKLTMLNGMNETKIVASGRTDALVHAINQKAHFDFIKEIEPSRVKKSLNDLLLHQQNDIYIKDVKYVNDDFNARHDVKEKTYEYKLNCGEYNPIEANYVYQYCKKLDVEKMIEASQYLLGEHDFASFVKKDSLKEDSVRTIYSIKIDGLNDYITVNITGNGFMRYMVRNIVGLLISVGEDKKRVEEVQDILDKKDRIYSTKTAPACGLYLKDVKYE